VHINTRLHVKATHIDSLIEANDFKFKCDSCRY